MTVALLEAAETGANDPTDGHDRGDWYAQEPAPTTEEMADAHAVELIAAGPKVAAEPVRILRLREFLAEPFPPATSLAGVPREGTNLLPKHGWCMPWGPAGSGKTSILVDLLFHLAQGVNWIGYPINQALRIVVIVNEGIPGGFQDKLREKAELWDTDAPLDNIHVYTSPWGAFNFRHDHHFSHLQAYCRDLQADLVAADPLHTIGTTGAGTPDDTEKFKHLLRNFGIWEWIALLTPHHSNKAGMVSGDWTRQPDTVIHLEKDGRRPATKFTLEKARPADPDELGVPQLLEWDTTTKGYTRKALETVKVPDEELLERIYTIVTDNPGISLSVLQQEAKGDTKRIGALAKREISEGRIANISPRKDWYKLTLPTNPGFAQETDNTDNQLDAF